MTIQVLDTYTDACQHLGVDSQLDADGSAQCQLSIACKKATIGLVHTAADAVSYTMIVAFSAEGDTAPPVLACEDCYVWIYDVIETDVKHRFAADIKKAAHMVLPDWKNEGWREPPGR